LARLSPGSNEQTARTQLILPVVVGLFLMAHTALAAGRGMDQTPANPSPWVATWGTSLMSAGEDGGPDVSGQTLRLIVHTSLGGPRVRVWLSNRSGSEPLRIGAAHIAVSAYTDPLTAADGSAVWPETDRALKFEGRGVVTIPAGATIVSDPVTLDVPPLSDLAVSLYFPEHTNVATFHGGAQQISYAATGNVTSAPKLAGSSWTTHSWFVLSGVDVYVPGSSAVVALGDSITDGNHSTSNANHRWPDYLATRLQADQKTSSAGVLGVVNAGISGNRVLLDGTGPNAMARFEWDVLTRSGVRYLILFDAINDIEAVTRNHQPYTGLDEQLEWALAHMTRVAHEHGILVFGATQMPDCRNLHCASAEGEASRQALNSWIRTSPIFDGVIDFDLITCDPAHPSQLLPRYDSGDSVHPNDEGYAAMANGIDLNLFTTTQIRPVAAAHASLP